MCHLDASEIATVEAVLSCFRATFWVEVALPGSTSWLTSVLSCPCHGRVTVEVSRSPSLGMANGSESGSVTLRTHR